MGGGDSSVKETAEQKALAEVAMKRWKDYQQKFSPYEDDFMRKVDRLNTDSAFNQAGNMAAASVSNEFSGAINNTITGMTNAGINPASGMFRRELDKLQVQKAKAQADTVNQAEIGQQDRYTQGISNIVAMGQGQAGEAMGGLGDIANNANRYAANQARSNFANNQDTQAAVGGVIGAGARYGLNYLDGGN